MRVVRLGPKMGLWGYSVREDGAVLDVKGDELKMYPSGIVRLRKDSGGILSISAHRLVALAFDLPRGEGQNAVRFKDGDKTNQRPDNLEWYNPHLGPRSQARTPTQRDIIKMKQSGLKVETICQRLGVSRQYINKTWRERYD